MVKGGFNKGFLGNFKINSTFLNNKNYQKTSEKKKFSKIASVESRQT